MKNTKRTVLTGSFIAGAFMATSSLNASESNLFSYNDLGTGSEIRANLLEQDGSDFRTYLMDQKCGEETKKVKEGEKAESKSPEAKCGEGKCGENKAAKTESKETKEEVKSEEAGKESKASEAKCGEGKCGVA